MVVRAWALLAVVVLAGCSGDDVPRKAPDQFDLDDVEVETTQTTGGIRGVVVDQAIRPIAGATLSLVDGARNTTTDDGGQFAFGALEPGAYFLHASAPGFTPVQASAEVSAGAITDVRVLMTADLSPVPYHETIAFDGFIDHSVPLATYIADIFLTSLLNQSICKCWQVFDSGPATTIVFEMVWEATSEPPVGEADLYYQFAEHDGPTQNIQSEFHASPILEHFDREALFGNWTVFDVHYGGGSNWVQVNQKFSSFITLWYNAPAPEGWSLVAGDE